MLKAGTEDTASPLGSQGPPAEVFAILSVLDVSDMSIPTMSLQD